MSNNYSIIVFTEDNTVEAVPTSWVKKKDGIKTTEVNNFQWKWDN